LSAGADPVWLDVLIFGSLGLLGAGYFWKRSERHLLRVAGFVGVGFFWLAKSLGYVAEGSDAVNITFTALAFPFFVYLAYHEWLCFEKDEELPALKWATGATFLAGVLYFAVDLIPQVASALIQTVAYQSLWLLQIFGYGPASGWWVDPTALVPTTANAPPELGALIHGSNITIILACTSYEAIVIFLGAVFAAQMRKDPWADYTRVNEKKIAKLRAMTPEHRKWLGLLYTVPVIWVLNLVRNSGVLYLYTSHALDGTAQSLGMTPFDFAHVLLGKGLSFVALVVIAFVLFKTCPEILDNVNGLMDLPKRGKKKGGGGASNSQGESPGKSDPSELSPSSAVDAGPVSPP
jgi:exosortase/archaeosortase family protein